MGGGAALQLERVDNVIKALGLDKCRDTIIGDHLRRGVSGAYARACTALQQGMLRRPSALEGSLHVQGRRVVGWRAQGCACILPRRMPPCSPAASLACRALQAASASA